MSASIRTVMARGVGSSARVSSQRVVGLEATRGLVTAAMLQRPSLQQLDASNTLVLSMRLLSLQQQQQQKQQGRGFSTTAAVDATTATKKPAAKKTPAAGAAAAKKKPAAKKPAAAAAGGRKKPAATKKKAAAKKKPAAKKKAKKVAKKKKVVKKRKVRKVLTPSQKLKLRLREARAKALLPDPKGLPETRWLVFIVERTQRQATGGGPLKMDSVMPALAQEFKNLPNHEVQRLQETAAKNREANKAAYKAWVDKHNPEAVRAANSARTLLNKSLKRDYKTIKDHRLPKRASGAYVYFSKTRWDSGDFASIPLRDATKSIAAEWKGLSDAARQPFLDHAKAESDRYKAEVEVLRSSSKSASPAPSSPA